MPNWNPFRRKDQVKVKNARAYLADAPKYKSHILGGGQCHVTGIVCPVCTQWGAGGPFYPTVDCSTLYELGEDITKYIYEISSRKSRKPMTPTERNELAEKLIPVLGQDRPIGYGAIFGVSLAEAKGPIGDFAWQTRGLVYVRESVFREINEAGFPLVGVPAPLKFQKDPGERLILLELLPSARRLASTFKQCEICDRILEVEETLRIDGSSFDDSIPIQCVYEWPATAVFSADLADYIRERGFTDISLSPIEVV
ncbi:MAG: hypothetical protein IMF08_18220 [Proteobacteria bacterium]|nr:hypothetical protein [Pseudomonadota bacterium]